MRSGVTIVLLLVLTAGYAQTEFSLYRLNATLPQANMINPAFAPNAKMVIGLPVISSIYAAVDLDGIAFRDLFITSGATALRLDTLRIPDKMKVSNFVRINEALQLLYLGRKFGKSYVSLGLHQVAEFRVNYPGDIVGWAIRGPGDGRYAGRPLDLGNFDARGIVYNKASVSLGRGFGDRLRLGARFNYLLGVGMGETTKLSGQLLVGIDSVSINTGEILVQSAGYDFFSRSNLKVKDYVDYFVKTGNKGIAWDFGASYQITRRLSVSAAVNDLGFITWKQYTRSYQLAPINYTFRGIDFLDYLNNPGQQTVQNEIDSLITLFTPTETIGAKYTSALIGKVYAGVNYHILGVNNLSAMVYFDLFQNKVNPAISLGYNVQLGRLLNATIGATFQNKKLDNIGAGLSLKLFKFQIYATSDRATSFIYPARATRADIHTGLNFVFGKNPKDLPDEKDKEPEKEKEPPKEEPEEVKEEPKKDSVVQEPPKEEPAVDTTRQAPVETKTEVVPETQPVVTPPVVTPPLEERHEVVTQGVHRDELPVSHFVVVGTFAMKANAERHSRILRQRGYNSQFGFVSERSLYYVYVHRSKDLEETRRVRDRYRQIDQFELPDSWVLTVLDNKFK